mgnify:CR=1 FL=1
MVNSKLKVSTVAIVGAGISGLACASLLSENGFKVTVFDKGRHPGGRLASRDRDDNSFDYGAQYFTARDSRFKKFLAQLVHLKEASEWSGKFAKLKNGCLKEEILSEPRFVGVSTMRSIADFMASKIEIDCLTSHRVSSFSRQDDKWLLTGTVQNESGETLFSQGDFDFLVLSLPPAQAAALHPHSKLNAINLKPCIALLLAFNSRVNLLFDGISTDDKIISWVARDSSKPGRTKGERWVIHASADWSEEHFQASNDDIERLLTQRFATIFDIDIPDTIFSKIHKWRYALPVSSQDWQCIYDQNLSLAYCGDWCVSARVESAFLSGIAVAEEMIKTAQLR